ncbi:MAG: hypothetical protein F4Y60_07260 [Boseongicola sp. SB0664_bin_43]|uniref:BIG2 domain-containing protein n=1 Tax=Boseongicola sp. SB0664_bin_43 TaxID=2604844 RepID=A0A6B0Y1A0_9RHOB|nr:hypothetical protein [Boseongicola sp. SB0664_bin_43]
MKLRNRVSPNAWPIFAALAGAIVLASCGGSSSPGGTSLPSAGGAPEMTVTPPRNRAPETKGTVPALTLSADGRAESVDVAAYFRDPDGDDLAYSAASDRPDIVEVAMSGSTLTLTPVSTGTAIVTVTASDGIAEAVQTVAVTVPERRNGPESTQEPATNSPPAQASEESVQEPEKRLTGIRITLGRRSDREASMRMTTVPDGAPWSNIGFDIDPFEAGRMCCYSSYADIVFLGFRCQSGYNGSVSITTNVSQRGGPRASRSVSFTCR